MFEKLLKRAFKTFLGRVLQRKKIINSYVKPLHLQSEKDLVKERIILYKGLLENNGWVFSKKKSGTTKFLNTLAFYRAEKYGINQYNFDTIAKFGVVRNNYLRNFENIDGAPGQALAFCSHNQEICFFHTHYFFDVRPKILIIQTRHIFDYCVSFYFHMYKNRFGRENVKFDEVIDLITDEYIGCHKQQIDAVSKAECYYVLSYEAVQLDTFNEYSKIIQLFDQNFSAEALKLAIEKSSIENLQRYEKEVGHALLVSKETFSAKSFIRSGEVGEGEMWLTPKQKEYIETRCSHVNVPLNGEIRSNL